VQEAGVGQTSIAQTQLGRPLRIGAGAVYELDVSFADLQQGERHRPTKNCAGPREALVEWLQIIVARERGGCESRVDGS